MRRAARVLAVVVVTVHGVVGAQAWAASDSAAPLTLTAVFTRTLEQSQELGQGAQDVESVRGIVQTTESTFDTSLEASLGLRQEALPGAALRNDDVTGDVGLVKQFSFGTTVALALGAARNVASPLTRDVVRANTGAASVRVGHRVLRNEAAREVVVAAHRGARAAEEDYLHLQNLALRQAAAAFWSARASALQLHVLRDAEARAARLVVDTEILIRADQLPKAELLQLRANVTDKGRARRDAEHALFEARTRLAVNMGAGALAAQDDVVTPFPAPAGIPALDALLQDAMDRRRDLRAAALRVDATEDLVRLAGYNLLPSLDVQADMTWLGRNDGATALDAVTAPVAGVHPVVGGDPGYAVGVGLVFALPVENNLSGGTARRARAAHLSAKLARAALKRDVEAAVRVAFDELETAVSVWDAARQSVALSRTAVENERIKRKSGAATLIDVVLLEDRLTLAMLEEAVAEARTATAWATLCFEAGVLDVGSTAPDALASRLSQVGAP
jgi:outer membrane protein